MPLTRDRILGHDNERLAFRFTMLNAADTVECQISDAALDELGGVKGTESIARQAQFLALRDAVEGIASDMFDKGACDQRPGHQDIHQAHSKVTVVAGRPDRDRRGAGYGQNASLRVVAETRPASAAQ